MHPPKADTPTGRADPSKDERDGLDIEVRVHSAIIRR